MATSNPDPDRVDGPDHRAVNVAADETSGTPPQISARTRTAVYVGCLALDVLTILILGLLVIFEIITVEKAGMAGALVLGAIGLVNSALAVGYRPTRPGSPVAPQR